jgi:hypothetical protein
VNDVLNHDTLGSTPIPLRHRAAPGGQKVRGMLDYASPPAGIAQSWRGDLCITAPRSLAFPCREEPPSALAAAEIAVRVRKPRRSARIAL